MRPEKKKLVKKCDTLWAEIVKRRENYTCQRCKSKTKQLNACHFYSRTVKVLRWDTGNGFCLCVGGHFYFHQHPAEFVEWVKETIGEAAFEILKLRSYNKLKTSVSNLRLVKMMLEKELRDLLKQNNLTKS